MLDDQIQWDSFKEIIEMDIVLHSTLHLVTSVLVSTMMAHQLISTALKVIELHHLVGVYLSY